MKTHTAATSYIQIEAHSVDNQKPDYTSNGTETIFIAGAQVELGSFPTSYIGTTNGSAVRSADVCQLTGSSFSGLWNKTEGSVAVEGDSPASGTRPLASADDDTANESAILFSSGIDLKFSVADGGVSQANINASAITAATAFNLAACYKANDFAVSVGGASAVTDTNGTLPTVDRLRVGADQAGNYLNGHIARLCYYRRRLSNARLQELTK